MIKRIFATITLFVILISIDGCSFINTDPTDPEGKNNKDKSNVESIEKIVGEGAIKNADSYLRYLIAADNNKNTSDIDINKDNGELKTGEEFKGIWITYYELNMSNNQGEKAFREKISVMFQNVSEMGFNAVFVHVRPFSDAFYKSEYYPWSGFLTGSQGKDPGYDPLEIMCEIGAAQQLQVHAWINPYRVHEGTDINQLSENNPARRFLEDEDKSNDDCVYINNGIYYNPAKEEVKKLIADGVKEIAENYDVAGIHFDDYFYPECGLDIDQNEYTLYSNLGGELSREDWRRANVSSMVSRVYDTIKSVNKNTEFGISPQGSLSKNKNEMYADTETWASVQGYVDYLLPQIYYGFENKTYPFEESVNEWSRLMKKRNIKLYIGLAGYKIGQKDQYAGTELNGVSPQDEWINNDDMLSRQLKYAREMKNYKGMAIFSYSDIFERKNDQNVRSETNILKKML